MDFTPTSWDKNHNPAYISWAESHGEDIGSGRYFKAALKRDSVISKYGFAIPTRKALRMIQALSPNGVFEIGAGTGYWAYLLSKLGVDVLACDIGLKSYRTYFKIGAFSKVVDEPYEDMMKRDPSVHKRTLLMVWPDYDNKQAFDAYKGDTVIYVGEIGDGCTGYDEAVEKKWKLAKVVKIPVWEGIHDSMGIFKRKGR